MNNADNNVKINELISLVKQGDQPAFAELLERYKPLLVSLVAKYDNNEINYLFEDLLQEATLVFYNAILTYDQTQSEVEFGLYAKICVSNALVSQMRAINRRCAEHSTELFLQTVCKDELFEDLEREMVAQENLRAMYSVIKSSLSEYEYLVWHYYMIGKTANEIGRLVNSDQKSVTNAIYRIRKKLRVILK